jgi:hypothetical protein
MYAERMGFEPTMSFWPIHTFQACSFDHSDTSLNGAAKIGEKVRQPANKPVRKLKRGLILASIFPACPPAHPIAA